MSSVVHTAEIKIIPYVSARFTLADVRKMSPVDLERGGNRAYRLREVVFYESSVPKYRTLTEKTFGVLDSWISGGLGRCRLTKGRVEHMVVGGCGSPI